MLREEQRGAVERLIGLVEQSDERLEDVWNPSGHGAGDKGTLLRSAPSRIVRG